VTLGYRIDRDGWMVRSSPIPSASSSTTSVYQAAIDIARAESPSRVTGMVIPATVSRPISPGSQILNTIKRKHPIKKHVPQKKPTAIKWSDDPALAYKPFDPTFCDCRKWNGGHGAQCNRNADDDGLCGLHRNQLAKIRSNGGRDLSYGRFSAERPTHCCRTIAGKEHRWKDLIKARSEKNKRLIAAKKKAAGKATKKAARKATKKSAKMAAKKSMSVPDSSVGQLSVSKM